MVLVDPLISVDALAIRLDDPTIRIVDCRWYLGRPGDGRRAYEMGHVSGAIHLDVDGDLGASPEAGPGRHPLPEVGAFVRRLEAAGIGDEHLVVAYDDVGGWVAARLWWMLEDLGHEAVVVLDGGWPAWLEAGGAVSVEEPVFPASTLHLAGHWTRVIDVDALRPRLGSVVLLDARGAPRYRGETEPIDAYPGHIPTAVSAPTEGNLAPDGRFLGPDALLARYRGLGADGTTGQVVTSCGSGVSACHDALALRIAGLPDPLLYPGSYSDWSRRGLPVAMGPDPGLPV
jgi:thiosulfate/3-mercaptopyruvate sulfurtransferase